MDVREKLVEIVCDAMEADGCIVHCNHPPCFAVERVVNALIAHGVTVQEWILVKDRLPENDYGKHWKERKYYLVRLEPSGLMCVAQYGYKEYDWWIDRNDRVLSAANSKKVTHWMEIKNLPQPLEGE